MLNGPGVALPGRGWSDGPRSLSLLGPVHDPGMSAQPAFDPYAPPRATTTPTAAGPVEDVFARDRYFLRQKLFAISERYQVRGEGDEVLLYLQRPAVLMRRLLAVGVLVVGGFTAFAAGGVVMAESPVLGAALLMAMLAGAVALSVVIVGRRHLRICRDDGLVHLLLSVSQDNLWQLPVAHWSLRDGRGEILARFRKNLLWNLVRRRWDIILPDGSAFLVKEDSLLKAILRRVVPNMIAVFMRTNFVFLAADGLRLGVFNRKLAVRDHYVLDLGDDPDHRLDRRVALAMAVLLDTGERR